MSARRKRRDRSPRTIGVARGILLAVAFLAPFPFGAVHPWAYSLLGLLLIAALGAVLASPTAAREAVSGAHGFAVAALLSLGALGALQAVALPRAVTSAIAPDRVAAAAALEPGEAPRGTVAEEPLRRALPDGRGVPLGFTPDGAREDATKLWILAAALAVGSVTLKRRSDRRLLALVLAASGTLVSLLGLARRAHVDALYTRYLNFYPHPYGPYVNRNHFAGLIELCLPLTLALFATSWLGLRKEPGRSLLGVALGAGGALVMWTALLDAGSRGGLLGATIGFVVFLLLLARNPGSRQAAPPLAAAAAVGLVALLFLAERPLGATAPIDIGEASVQDRLLVWQGTLGMIAERPLLGVGYGAFEEAFAPRRPRASEWRFEHPENDYLLLGAEGGALALGALLALLAAGARAVGKGLQRSAPEHPSGDLEAPDWSFWAAAVASCTSLVVHGFIDVNLHVTANAILFTVLGAVVLAPPGVRSRGEEQGRPAEADTALRGARLAGARIATALAITLAALHLARVATADLVAHSGLPLQIRAASDDDPARLERAARLDPLQSSTHLALGRLEERTALNPAGVPSAPESERAAAPKAFLHLATAARIRPLDATAVFELGWMSSMWQETPGVSPALAAYGERLMRRALELDPSRADLRARLGAVVAFGGGSRLQEGLAELREAFALDPSLQDDLLWLVEQRLPAPIVARAVPDRAENRLRYARRLESRGQHDPAVAQYERALALVRAERVPETAMAITRQVAERLAVLDPERGVEIWSALVAVPAPDVRDLQGLAAAQSARGLHADAKETLTRAVALRPSPEIRVALAWACYQAGDCATATETASAVLAAKGSNVEALLVSALCQVRAGNLGSAYATLQRVVKLDPKRDDVRSWLEQVRRQLNPALGSAPDTSRP